MPKNHFVKPPNNSSVCYFILKHFQGPPHQLCFWTPKILYKKNPKSSFDKLIKILYDLLIKIFLMFLFEKVVFVEFSDSRFKRRSNLWVKYRRIFLRDIRLVELQWNTKVREKTKRKLQAPARASLQSWLKMNKKKHFWWLNHIVSFNVKNMKKLFK